MLGLHLFIFKNKKNLIDFAITSLQYKKWLIINYFSIFLLIPNKFMLCMSSSSVILGLSVAYLFILNS